MSKEEKFLICPSCKVCEINLSNKKYYCEHCKLFYKIKEGFPVLIDFGLENVLIKENEIRTKKKTLNNKFKNKILNYFYGDSEVTEKNVRKFLDIISETNKKVLVIGGATRGSGTNKLWENQSIKITSIDLIGTENVDYIVDAHYLPFKADAFDAIWIQAVLEHVLSPESVVKEIFRVIKNDGIVYSEIPFMQQIHMGKNDFTSIQHLDIDFYLKNLKQLTSA